jgi:hypothetical protein
VGLPLPLPFCRKHTMHLSTAASFTIAIWALSCACAATEDNAKTGDPQTSKLSVTPLTRAEIVQAFRELRDEGRLEDAAGFIAADPRKWYDQKEGEGRPWTLSGPGRWQAWDDHFRGTTEQVSEWREETDSVHADFFEINDYYRLTERGGGYWRGTYIFDGTGQIAGFMISGVPEQEAPSGRREEFQVWARSHYPDEAEYLMPKGSLDPTGDRAPRMRSLLNQWRTAIELDPIL